MYCTKCGKEMPENSKICPTCGAENDPKTPSGETFTEQASAFFGKVKDTVNSELNPDKFRTWGAGRILLLISGFIIFLSTVTPLLSFRVFGYGRSFNMYQIQGFIAFVTLVGAGLAIAGGIANKRGLKVAALVITIITTIIWIINIANGYSVLPALVGKLAGLTVGFGFIINLIGLGLLIVAFSMDRKR